MSATERLSPLGVSPLVLDFIRQAVRDARDRIGDRVEVSTEPVADAHSVQSIVDWAKAMGLSQVVTPYIPVGPTAELAGALRAELAKHGIGLIATLRVWDRLAWPHATRGFFQFREKIPIVLAEMCRPGATAA